MFDIRRDKHLIFIFSFFLFVTCSQDEDEISWFDEPAIHYTCEDADISFFACIWDKVPHAAFTDLIEYNGKYYCCFREANNHVPKNKSEYGRIRILESTDGAYWYSIAIINDSRYDLRDPKFSITPDGRLMLLMGAAELNSGFAFRNTKVSYSYFDEENVMEDQKKSSILFSNPVDISLKLDTYWLWRVTWKDNIAYGVAYDGLGKSAPYLVKSLNGVDYEIITKLSGINISNEADIHFTDDKMTIVIRNNNNNGYIGTSVPPYTNWDWIGLNMVLQSPTFVVLNDKLFVSGRGPGALNVLYSLNDNKLSLLYTFPGSGDSAYPGAIHVGEELWISYYTTSNRVSIYLAKISVNNIFKRMEGI